MVTRRGFIGSGAVGVAGLAFGIEGCTAEQWFTLVESLIPVTLQTATGLGAILGLPAADVAVLTAFAGSAKTILDDVEADVQAFKTSQDTTLIGHIESLLNSLKTQAAGIAASLQVKDAGLLAKVAAFTDAVVADAIDLLSLLPTVTKATANAATTRVIVRPSLPKGMKETFQRRLAAAKAKLPVLVASTPT